MSVPNVSAPVDADVPPLFRKWPEGAEIKTFTGGCHCRKFAYELEHPVLEARPPISCNCSACTQTGEIFVYAPEARFRFTTGSLDETSVYEWNKKMIKRRFCPVCSSNILYTGLGLVGVNVRTFDGIDINALKLEFVDGKQA
ncbi:hypothetical protein EW145_g3715 [Phellinidium pouzarii]|uniref:CENP-V/GFA domain-containing protein n=1 Tax=Phellinidium pouzarii TaxID=167371 RepID=A0A4S4L6L6_9AGAM|nr:hypothetical protein EW145_g3715 [Phellinidium pouzarii]